MQGREGVEMGREIPILMSGPLVRATLAGLKTQTRRPIKRENKPDPGCEWAECLCREIDPSDTPCVTCEARFPGVAAAGDRLWVRETWRIDNNLSRDRYPQVVYRADKGFMVARNAPVGVQLGTPNPKGDIWTPSIHMPRWACRLVLPLVSVRVERVQDITEDDAIAEGVPHNSDRPIDRMWCDTCLGHGIVERFALGTLSTDDCTECDTAKKLFRNIWVCLYGQDSWVANPWVVVYEWGQIEVSR